MSQLIRRCVYLFLISCCGSVVNALELDPKGTVQLHGFASQGYVWTSEYRFFGNSEAGGSFNYRELGLNASWQPNSRVFLAGQILARDAGDTSEADPRMDYLNLSVDLVEGLAGKLGIRAGRVKTPYGLYNDTRDVIFTRPSILMPHGVYQEGAGFRNLLFSADGVMGYGQWNHGDNNLEAQFLWVDDFTADDQDAQGFTNTPGLPGTLDFKNVWGFRLIESLFVDRLRLGFTWLQFDSAITPNAGIPPTILPAITTESQLFVASAEFNFNRNSLVAEYNRLTSIEHIPVIAQRTKGAGDAAYLQYTRRWNPQWQSYARIDLDFSDMHDRDGRDFQQRTTTPRYQRFTRDYTIGGRWDIRRDLGLWAEYHYIDGVTEVPTLDNPNRQGAARDERYWHLIAVMLGYRF